MAHRRNSLVLAYWAFTTLAFAVALVLLAAYTPVDTDMGPIQKIFYLHMTAAICAFGACAAVFVASIGYLWQRRLWWDDLGAASGKVATLFCGVVLITGMVWARSYWGHWWTWSPRLTFSLVLFCLYATYLLIRPAIEGNERRAVVCAVYGIAAFLDVPLVYLSVRLMPDIHPSSISLDTGMKLTLLVWFVPMILMAIGLVAAKYRLNRRMRARHSERTPHHEPTPSMAPS